MPEARVMEKNRQAIVAVSAYITNDKGEVLLVKSHARADTWELPGGQVEAGEALDQAIQREVHEETGVDIRLIGISGVYYNETKNIINIVFRAKYVKGSLSPQPEEIQAARFVLLDASNVDEYVTWPHLKSRVLDALNGAWVVPYETWAMEPSRRVARVER